MRKRSIPEESIVTRADTLATQAYQAIRLALLHGQLVPDIFYSENSVASSASGVTPLSAESHFPKASYSAGPPAYPAS